MDPFPFCMSDIVGLLNLTIRRKHASSIDVDCPFCNHKKGILNINLEKNVYRCNYCDKHGGMLSLYGSCYNLSNQESYIRIVETNNTHYKIDPIYKRNYFGVLYPIYKSHICGTI